MRVALNPKSMTQPEVDGWNGVLCISFSGYVSVLEVFGANPPIVALLSGVISVFVLWPGAH